MSKVSNGIEIKNGDSVDCQCDSSERLVWEPEDRIKKEAHLSSMAEYRAMYRESVENPETFWTKIASQFHWKEPPRSGDGSFLNYNFDHTKGPVSIKWMEGGVTNVCYNAVDRHIGRRRVVITRRELWIEYRQNVVGSTLVDNNAKDRLCRLIYS